MIRFYEDGSMIIVWDQTIVARITEKGSMICEDTELMLKAIKQTYKRVTNWSSLIRDMQKAEI